MITFKVLGKKSLFPTEWNDMTYSQYIYHIYPRTFPETIAQFTGIDLQLLKNSELKGLEKINIALSFMAISPKFSLTDMVGPYFLPKDVTIQSLGQFEDLRALLNKMPKKKMEEFEYEDHEKMADLYLEACAVYVQKVKDGKYDYSKVPQVKEELKSFSCGEVIGTGAFFLFRPLNISPPSTTLYQRVTFRTRRLIQGLPGYQRTLDFLLRSSK